MDAISVRPRTLSELSSATGISVQGVLRHLGLLKNLGLVEERPLKPRTPKARTVYAAGSTLMGDYSTQELTVVKSTQHVQHQSRGGQKRRDLESVAGDLLVQKRRIAVEARRLARLIDGYVDGQEGLRAALGGLGLDPRERLILTVLLTEETTEDGVKALARHYGLKDRRSIERALAKANRSVGG